jgi:membrane associated rhomboid family serine protease
MQAYRIYPQKRNLFSNLSVTTSIIFANVILFLVFLIIATKFGWDYIAIKPANIIGGKYLWTILTSMFMHGGIFHIFANMISLMFIGGLVEKLLGPKRYFWFYMLSGIFAGLLFVLLSLIFNIDLNTYAVGASGALFGLVGFLVLITPNLPVYLMFVPIPIKMKYAGPGILILLWFISIAGSIPIGNTAHLGGLLAGLAYGIYIKTKYKNKSKMISKKFS